jgi:hypothetical protein
MSPRKARRPTPKPPPHRKAPAPGTRTLSSPLLALGWLSLSVYVTVMTVFKMSNNDIWIHLRTGEYVLATGWPPIKDPYSFTAADHDYVAHEWLAGVLFYLVYAAGGVTGLIVFKALVVAASCALLYAAARAAGARLSVILPAFACLLYIASARYLERPHIFSYLMAALYLWLFFRYREAGRDRRWLYPLLPAHTIWTNLHGGYVQGLGMVGTFALGEALGWARARLLGRGGETAPAAADVRLLAALVPACLVASLLNPYGHRALTFPFELTGLELYMQRIYEWKPPYDDVYNRSTMFVLYLVYVGTLCATFFLAYRDRARESWIAVTNALLVAGVPLLYLLFGVFWFETPGVGWTPPVLARMLYAILVLFCVFTVVNLRTVDFVHAGLFTFFFLLALRHNRAVTDAAMGMFVTLTAAASRLLDQRAAAARLLEGGARARPDRSSPIAVALGSALLLGVSAHASVFTYYYDFAGSGREKGLGVADTMPICAVDFIERHRITGNAFVTYQDAAMLIHRMHPQVKVNMDSRNDVYGEALYREYLATLGSPAAMRDYLARHRVDFFLLSFDRVPPLTVNSLLRSGAWAPVHFDDHRVVLLRRGPGHEALVNAEEFRLLRPYTLGALNVDASNASALLAEAERAIRNCPSAVLAYFVKGDALRALDRHEEALAATGEVLVRDPRNVYAYSDLAESYAALGRRREAIEMLESALRIQPGYNLARENLKRLRGS